MTDSGVQRFANDLGAAGAPVDFRGGVVVFPVQAMGGARAGDIIECGFDESELHSWPLTPPHWIHVPSDVALPGGNQETSAMPGFTRHSRTVTGWDGAPVPARALLAHVRGVLDEAA